MDNVVAIIVAVFASTGFWAFVTKLTDNRKKKHSSTEKMVLALVRDKLLFLNKKYRKLGYIPTEDYECYFGIGESYIEAGGNSAVKKGFEENKKLPLKDEEDED